MNIFIKVNNLTLSIELNIDTVKNECICNGKAKNVDTISFLHKLQSIIASWKYSYVNNSVVDGETYSITMTKGDKSRKYIGINSFPYSEFKSLICEVVSC